MTLADSATNRASSPPDSSSSPSPPRDALDIPSESHEDDDASAPGDTAARPKTKRGSRGKFTKEQDLVLLCAITRYAPYAAEHDDIGKTWEDVASSASASLQLPFTGRACSYRFKALKKWYQTWKEGSEFRSGSGEPETVKMRLLEEITTLEADGKLVAMNKKFAKEKTEKEKSSTGDKLMEAAEQRLSDRSEAAKSKERGSTKKRQRDDDLELLEKQLEHEAERLQEKARRRELQQQQLEFERHKYETEMHCASARWSFEPRNFRQSEKSESKTVKSVKNNLKPW